MPAPVDQAARDRALEPGQSFIVQAPAGSGKTGLLTQRYLVLLATVDNPEEIIAITFTRKAAGEMRERILQALESARLDAPPEDAHLQKTWALARKALARDEAQGWQLLDNPGRMRIKTIDALSTDLARQMPLLSEFGAVPGIAEDARPLYQEAARTTLEQLEAGDEWSEALLRLMRHRDNRLDDLQRLIAEMLARRDQWLRHVADPDNPQLRREEIEPVLRELVEEALERLVAATPEVIRESLPRLIRFAADHLLEGPPIHACRDLETMPGSALDDLAAWTGIAELLMTKGRADDRPWRKSVTKAQGFPAESAGENPEEKALLKDMKGQMQELLQQLVDEEAFRRALGRLNILPNPAYSDDEWSVLEALFRVLLLSAAQLRGIFSNHGQVDFIEVAMRANQALGSDERPTDLALRLDYRLRHLLVDEFQDTSQNQYDLFQRLTAGWQPDDGRSLFLVGDPMQSIYRFREAEVGLFLQAWEDGLGSVALEPLSLSVNFRSQAGLIEWVNSRFERIMPKMDDKAAGAVSYARSETFRPALAGDAVTVYPYLDRNDEDEAAQVVDIIQHNRAENPAGSVAVLARNKGHLAEIVHRLKDAGLRFQAVEIESLAKRPVVRDLMALSCALLHLADRISWLAVVRAPFIGLRLADLHILAADRKEATIVDLLRDQERIAGMSEEGRRRILRAYPLLEAALKERDRKPLRTWIEGLWIALGGPACIRDDNERVDAEVFFQTLEALDGAPEVLGPEALQQKIVDLYSRPDVHAGEALQLMTIHKAKGLEFDTVIVPGLGRTPRSDNTRLLYWLERTGQAGRPELIFGPIRSAWEDSNRTADYIRRLETEKIQYEDGRLLYVAATRAREHLHLLGAVNARSDGSLGEPAGASLLARLWPVVRQDYVVAHEAAKDKAEGQQLELPEPQAPRMRLSVDWQCPLPPAGLRIEAMQPAGEELAAEIEFDWAGEAARHVGTVVHRILQYLGSSDRPLDMAHGDLRMEAIARHLLKQSGLSSQLLEPSLQRVMAAVNNTLRDEKGLWVLSSDHRDIRNEYPLTGVIQGKVQRMVIDRTFVDEHDVRWIVDYKTSTHAGGGREVFLDQEVQRYRSQLQGYAGAFAMLEDREVRTGLYFPLMQAWREVH